MILCTWNQRDTLGTPGILLQGISGVGYKYFVVCNSCSLSSCILSSWNAKLSFGADILRVSKFGNTIA